MQSNIANNNMKKKILSILLCFCMLLSLLPMTAQAATHTLTVTGGTDGVDYQWGGKIYRTDGQLDSAVNALVILTDKSLTITGDTTSAIEYSDVISINNGVTANLTLNGVKIVSSISSAGITIAPGGVLNLTLQGTNTFQQEQDLDGMGYNYPAIRVPEGASLTVTAASTGSLTSSTYAGSAVIGGYNAENCGTVTINGGTFDLSATGASNVDYIGGPAIGPGAYANNGTITVNGGCIKAYSQWGAAIGNGYNVFMGQVGQQNETIAINGGTVVATTGHAMADGIGGMGGAIAGGVTISGGSVSTPIRNTRPKNVGGENLYKALLTLDGAATGTSVSSLTATTASGAAYSYDFKDIVTDSSGNIYVWLPEGAKVTKITAGGTNYTGASVVTANDAETEIFYPENSPVKKYTLTSEINDGRIFALSDVKCDLTIIDGNGVSEKFENLPFAKDANNPSRAVLSGYEFYTTKTGIAKIQIALSSGGISWEKDVPSDNNVWMVNIGARLYKTMLVFRNEAVTTDIAYSDVTVKQDGTQLDAAKGEFYVPDHISKQSDGYGTMEAYLPENSGSTEISVTAAALNSGNIITKSGQSVTTDGSTSILMLNKTNSSAAPFTDTLDISYGNITFEDATGDLKITYSDASGQKSVTTFYEAQYHITGSSIGDYYTKSNGIKVLSTGGTTLQLVLDNVSIEKMASNSNGDSDINSPPFNIEGDSKVSLLLTGKNKISSDVKNSLQNSRAAICVKENATLVIGGDGSLEASTASVNYASVIGGSGWSQYSDIYVDHCGTIRIEGGDITLNGITAGISGGHVGTASNYGAVSTYGSFTMTGGSLKINCSDNAIGVKDISITGGSIYVGDKTIYGDNSLAVAGGTIVAGNFNAGGSGSITVTGGTMFNASGEQTGMNKTAVSGTASVYPVTADVSNIYGNNAAVSDVVITGVSYSITDVKTDGNGVLHIYLPENANTNATFKGIGYQGSVSTGNNNILTIPCNHEQYTEDGYCTVCGSLQPANWNATGGLYEISNAGQLTWFSKLVNGTLSGTAQNTAANGKLLKNVTAGSLFKTLGSETSPYTGTFDGGGHTVTLSIDKGSSSYQGLFGAVGGGVTVKNVGTAGTVMGGAYTAGLIGGSKSSGSVTIQNCWNEATVTGTAQNAAGIFGCNASGATIIIENCYNIGEVSGVNESAGISGWLGDGATVKNCYNAGTMGGIENGKSFARYGSATFTNCYQFDAIGTQADITAKTLDEFKLGEVTYLLNGSKSEVPLTWGQTIGKDNYPGFYDGNNPVYKLDNGTYANSLVKLTVGSPSNITYSSADITASGDAGTTIYYAESDTTLTDGSIVEALSTAAGQTLLLQTDPATISLTGLAENKTFTYYVVAKAGSSYSNVEAVTFTTSLSAPIASDVSVDYTNELLKANSGLGYTLEYAFTSNAAAWTEVTTDGVSLTAVLNGHSGADPITLYVHKKAGSNASEAVIVTIPARPTTPAAPTAASDNIKDTSITLTSVPGVEYSKDNATWQDSTEFTGLSAYTGQTFYQRIKAKEGSFASAASSATIKTGQQSIASATVMLDSSSFTYNGSSQVPTATVMMGSAVLDASQYDISYANSKGKGADTVNVGTITVTVTAKADSNYFGSVKSTYTINPAVPAITWSEADKVQSVKYGKAVEIIKPAVTLVKDETFGGTITYSYKVSGSTGEYTSGLPTNAGTYLVKAHLDANGNYAAADSTNELTLTIEGPTDADKVATDKAALEIGYAPGDSADLVTQNISLTGTGAVFGSKITWLSSNPAVISNIGVVNRPSNASGDAYVTVTAGVYSNEVSDTKVFSLKVLKLAPVATDAEKVAVDKAVLTIGYAPGDSADKVTQNISLTVTGAVYGSKISWVSSNPAVILVNGTVIRPSYGSGDAYVTVTASAYSNEVGDKKVFSLKVLKLAQSTYAVTFKDWDGTVLNTQTVNEGSGATAPDNPSRDGYNFTGWDTVFSNVTSNLTVTAQYKKNTSGGGGSSGGGSGTSGSDTAKTYQAAVSENGAAETNVPVNINKDTGSAVIDVSAGQGDIVKGGGTVAITMPSIPDIAVYTINIPVPYLSNADASSTFTFKTEAGSIIVPSNMLKETDGEKGQKAQISIRQGDKSILSDEAKKVVGDLPIIQLTVAIDGNKIAWNNPDAPVTVSIPYKPTASELENPDSIVVWYIDGSGKAVSVPNGHYDAATGCVIFTTTHFSNYAVGYNKVSFSDVSAEAWYGKAVNYIAARGITTGTGNGCYNPEASITRGEFLVMLMRAYGINPDTELADNFADAGNVYYTGYLAAAKRLGISKGTGNNMFAPDMEITRQEMFTLLYNALKEIDQLPENNSGKQLSTFSDAQQIASWAKEALALFSEAGTINGNGNKLLPTETTTRAEMAQVLYNLMKG